MKDNPLKIIDENDPEIKPWYAEGLRFKCTECGKCCTGGPGYAWVTDEEIKKIATFLKMELKNFQKKYLRFVKGRYALVENRNYDCVFLRDKKCTIYPVRPTQCRTFPWWVQNLTSPDAWKEAARDCEGISEEAPIVPFSTIEAQLSIDKTEI